MVYIYTLIYNALQSIGFKNKTCNHNTIVNGHRLTESYTN